MGGGKEKAAPKLTRERLVELLEAEFPEAAHAVGDYDIEELWRGGCRVRWRHHEKSLRPGGTVSGPIMMGLADFTMYLAVLSAIGWIPLAVTTNLTINFLKKPGSRDLLAEARLLKLGKRLAVGEVVLRSEGDEDLVAHVTATYSIPAG
ncbi:MAG TPA: PaaI family thioesterase [Xanthobacteraceae bacterium]|jgi:uncharacterized protein (TIGR00369 family)|nr:PaaI family thioesterase [Xanthobacteraceae bacterium]